MPAEHIICIHQGEDGAVCGLIAEGHHSAVCGGLLEPKGCHTFTPGRKCPTCDGSSWIRVYGPYGRKEHELCPTCADSPVRGYVEGAASA